MIPKKAGPQEHITRLEWLLHEKSDNIKQIAARHGAYNIRVFGSVARGEAGPDSDIDFLIETGPTTTSWFPAGLILELEDLLGRRVEVVTEKVRKPNLRAVCYVKPYHYER